MAAKSFCHKVASVPALSSLQVLLSNCLFASEEWCKEAGQLLFHCSFSIFWDYNYSVYPNSQVWCYIPLIQMWVAEAVGSRLAYLHGESQNSQSYVERASHPPHPNKGLKQTLSGHAVEGNEDIFESLRAVPTTASASGNSPGSAHQFTAADCSGRFASVIRWQLPSEYRHY